jgi:hypothetical protein
MSTVLDAPTIEFPAIPAPPPGPDGHLFEQLHALQVTAVRLAEERDAARAETAEADLRVLRLEEQRDALLASCHARQSALADPTVRERLLEGQVAGHRRYIGTLERLLDAAEAPTQQAATVQPRGRRRRSR